MKISIVTATYNSMQYLPVLVESLRKQTDKDFEWVVADGASTDGTLEYLRSINDLDVKIISQEDFGIYDALNRGVKASYGDFYVVIGSDDFFYPNAISAYRSGLREGVDIVSAAIDFGDFVSKPRGKMAWFYGQLAYVSGHAVGSLFRKTLHDSNGYYSRRFPIAADQYFIMKSIDNGARVNFVDVVVGKHNLIGVSALDSLGAMTEWYRVMISLGCNKFLHTFMFIGRLLKWLIASRKKM